MSTLMMMIGDDADAVGRRFDVVKGYEGDWVEGDDDPIDDEVMVINDNAPNERGPWGLCCT
jgi:hypothetical protein